MPPAHDLTVGRLHLAGLVIRGLELRELGVAPTTRTHGSALEEFLGDALEGVFGFYEDPVAAAREDVQLSVGD